MSEDIWKDLNDYDSMVPENIWVGIEHFLIRRKRRKILFWIIALGILLISGSLAISYEKPASRMPYIPVSDQNQVATQPNPQTERNPVMESIATPLVNITSSPSIRTNRPRKTVKPTQSIQVNVEQKSIKAFEIQTTNNSKISLPEKDLLISNPMGPKLSRGINSTASLPSSNEIHPAPLNEDSFDRCNLPDPPIGCPGFGRKRIGNRAGRWALDLTYGPGYPLRTLTSKTTETDNYQNLRDAHESSIYDQTVQARLSYISPWNIGVRSGLHYGHTIEKFTLQRDSIVGSTTIITIDTLFNPDGSYTVTVDTNNIQTPGRLDKVTYNHFRTLQIPLILAYEKQYRDWTFHVNGGLLMNILLRRQGEILDPADQVVNIGSNEGNYDAFLDQWGLLFTASLGVNYRLTDRIHATLEPTIRHTLKSITRPSYSLDQKYTMVNLNIGLRYEF